MIAKELRLDNYVYDDMNNIVKIDRQDIGEEIYIFYKPIELTEEILLKCGFYFRTKNKMILNGVVIFLFKYGIVYKGEFLDTNIKYVHQLQNLYFALKGEELEIKL